MLRQPYACLSSVVSHLLIAISLLPMSLSAAEPVSPVPLTVAFDQAKAQLGKRLFLDPELSGDGSLACVSCHRLDGGGAEPKATSSGIDGKPGRANAPSVFNAALNFRQFWNGRVKGLRPLVVEHLLDPGVMGAQRARLERYLSGDGDYARQFAASYAGQRPGIEQLSDALAEFGQALLTPNARFDRWLRGELQLSERERGGYSLFKSLGCISCHNGVNLGGNSFQYLGAVNPLEHEPDGIDRYALTGDEFDKNRYKVPSLRNVRLTAPYLHDGRADTLTLVLHIHAYYNIGFQLSSDEVEQLSAFLDTLTGEMPAILESP